MGLKLGYGSLVQIDYKKGVGRVLIEDTEVISDWATLPKSINANVHYEINSQAVLVYDIENEYFEILNIVPYEDDDRSMLPPSWSDENTEGIKFSDGSCVTYDSNKKILTIDAANSNVKINCKNMEVSGNIKCDGDMSARNVKAKIQVTGGGVNLSTHVHPAPGGTTSIPSKQ